MPPSSSKNRSVAVAAAAAMLLTAAPAVAAPKADSPAHANRQQVTQDRIVRELQKQTAGGEVTLDDVIAAVENYESKSSWERDVDYTATTSHASEPGQVSVTVTEDGTIGFASVGDDGGCTMTTISPDGEVSTWSWPELGSNCSGEVAVGGPDQPQPAYQDPAADQPGDAPADGGDAPADGGTGDAPADGGGDGAAGGDAPADGGTGDAPADEVAEEDPTADTGTEEPGTLVAGTASTWGWNTFGQLGDGSTTAGLGPVDVLMPEGVLFADLGLGHDHTAAVDADGNLWTWGRNHYGQLGAGTVDTDAHPVPQQVGPAGVTFTTVDASLFRSVALDADGQVWSWGDNSEGELGDGTRQARSTPVNVTPAGVVFTDVSAGYRHTTAVDSAGQIWAWGDNYWAQLGDGTRTDRLVPTRTVTPAGVEFTSVASGNLNNAALDATGTVWGWGANHSGEVGDGTTTMRTAPVQAKRTYGEIAAISAGSQFFLALDTAGHVWTWGSGSGGALGTGTYWAVHVPTDVTPVGVEFSTAVAGGYFGVALSTTGDRWAWGWNRFGELGDGSTSVRMLPGNLGPVGSDVSDVAAGDYHAALIRTAP